MLNLIRFVCNIFHFKYNYFRMCSLNSGGRAVKRWFVMIISLLSVCDLFRTLKFFFTLLLGFLVKRFRLEVSQYDILRGCMGFEDQSLET